MSRHTPLRYGLLLSLALPATSSCDADACRRERTGRVQQRYGVGERARAEELAGRCQRAAPWRSFTIRWYSGAASRGGRAFQLRRHRRRRPGNLLSAWKKRGRHALTTAVRMVGLADRRASDRGWPRRRLDLACDRSVAAARDQVSSRPMKRIYPPRRGAEISRDVASRPELVGVAARAK